MDAPTLIALLVSFVALFVALIQLMQQLFSTASDYRSCSPTTIGGWAKRTRRKFIWKELRFQVLFSTPRIEMSVPLPLLKCGEVYHNTDSTSQMASSTTYHFCDSVSLSNNSFGFRWRDCCHFDMAGTENNHVPWYLSTEGTVPEARCSWLALLEATTLVTDVQIRIIERPGSYDYVPESFTRPVASMDRKSLLILLSLFCIEWKNRGKDGKLSGAGEFCELSVFSDPSFGNNFFHLDLDRQRVPGSSFHNLERRYELRTDRAVSAMFHCFHLGFATLRTHSETELKASLDHPDFNLGQGIDIDALISYRRENREFCPGIVECITCWAYASMPRMIYKDHSGEKFISIFSGASTISAATRTPKFVAKLLGDISQGSGLSFPSPLDSEKTIIEWAKEYRTSLVDTDVQAILTECFDLLVPLSLGSDENKSFRDIGISLELSLRCLKALQKLDRDLQKLLRGFDSPETLNIKRYISNKQIEYGTSGDVDEVKYMQIVEGLKGMFLTLRMGSSRYQHETVAQNIVINRLMRGALWSVHNGNPTWDPQSRVCSLSSSWLEENPTVYLS